MEFRGVGSLRGSVGYKQPYLLSLTFIPLLVLVT